MILQIVFQSFSLLCAFFSHVAAQRSGIPYAARHYENTTKGYLSFDPSPGPRELFTGQIYVESLVPRKVTHKYPLVFIPGGGQTGADFLNTPEGRPGWADYFLRFGYHVYLTDPTQRGRSPTISGEEGGLVGIVAAKDTEQYFTASSRYPDLWPQARLHTQWPGTGLRGDAIFDRFYASQVQLTTNSSISDITNRRAEIELLERIGPAIIVTHSQSGPWGWALADARPDRVKGVVAIEPEGPPFVNEAGPTGPPRTWGLTRLPVKYEPEVTDPDKDLPTEVVPAPPGKERDLRACTRQKGPAKKLANLSKVPVLLINGEASFHASYEYCTYGFLKQAGVNVEWLDLGAKGIKGNGHFLFMEKNNLQIAAKVHKWLSRAEGHGDL